ncbi:MAG: primosomal protein N' [Formivibrio sp.]|nr:primosomal protein N' [Formivibrio sp.]
MIGKLLKVALDIPLRCCFDYTDGDWVVGVGERVLVPFGSRQLSGIVHEVVEQGAEGYAGKIKAILAKPGDMPCLPASSLDLCRFVADYYQHPLGQVIAATLPAVFRATEVFTPPAPRQCYRARDVSALLASLPVRAKAQRRIAEALAELQTPAALRELAAPAMRWVRDWLAADWVEALPEKNLSALPAQSAPTLHGEQMAAVESIASTPGFASFLLFGITGSGKTEVYLHAIADKLLQQRQVLVLVPEINLTPQLVDRFRARFPAARIVSLHSGLNETERAIGWLAAQSGEADIVLGTRLAVFTPMPNLALIVVDEEHDSSYKQQDGLRYSARDVAVYRANQAQIPIILGSATPSLESWRNAEAGRYRLLELKSRAAAGAVLPTLRLLSMRRAPQREGLHEAAIAAIDAAMARNEQALVFINRRGYSPVLACGECGWMAVCRHCSARLVLHLSERRLRCHHCGHDAPVVHRCPDCGNQDLKPLGRGTQRLEAALQALFPDRRVLRIDRDSTRRKGSLDAALNAVHAGETDILIGTQMLAKGHDFSRLNCVVVLEADTGLFSVDFRAEERLFALLTQVAGRAGRREQPGEVLIQTQFPEHPFYARLLERDYRAFANQTLQERRMLRLPPWSSWALFRAEAKQLDSAMAFLQEIRRCFPEVPGLTVYEPVVSGMVKKAGMERAQLLITAELRGQLIQALARAMPEIEVLKTRNVRWSLDVDPIEVG